MLPGMPLPDRRTLILGLAAILLLAAAVAFWRGGGDARPPAPIAASSAADDGVGGAAPAPADEEPVIVHVTGEVAKPGVYEMPQGARVIDAIEEAGGMTRDGNAVALNLAALLADGEQVIVPALAPIAATGVGPTATGTGGLVHLNSADLDALDALPGIGPATAQRILDWRLQHGGFAAVEDLLEVPGIGPSKLEQLRDLVAP